MDSHISIQRVNKEKATWVFLVTSLFVFGLIYIDSILLLLNIWESSGTYSHGYLSAVLTLVLVYLARGDLSLSGANPFYSSLLFIFALTLVWLVASITNTNILQVLTLPFFLFFIVLLYLGWGNAKKIMLPIFLLLFSLPIWSVFLPALQQLTVLATDIMLDVFGISHQIEKNYVRVPQGVFEIEESCSGLRYLLVGMLLSFAYGFLNYNRTLQTFILVLSSIFIMIIGNYIRVLIIIMIGVQKGMSYPLVQDHADLGWVLFGVLLVPLFVVATKLNTDTKKVNKSTTHIEKNDLVSLSRMVKTFLVFLVVILVMPLYAKQLNIVNSSNENSYISEITLSADWVGPISYTSKWMPSYELYNSSYIANYEKDDKTVTLVILEYAFQNNKNELININNTLVDRSIWKIDKHLLNHRVKNHIYEAQINKATISSYREDYCLHIWYWYAVNDNYISRNWEVKVNEFLATIRGKSSSAFVSIATECTEKPEGADNILWDYLSNNYKFINGSLSQ